MSISRRALFVLAALATAACAGDPTLPLRTPNIILVTVDTLRADHMESYGYDRATSPVFARLANDGVRFDTAISQAPWTLPAMASVHSSLYPLQHGAFAAETALPEAADTLAEVLGAAGYRTVAVVSHEFVSRKHGFAQGFDIFDESNVRDHEAVTSRDVTLTALARLGEVEEPFFLWVHYFDPHFSYVRHPDIGFADGYTGTLPAELTSGLLTTAPQPMAAGDLDYVKAVYDEEITHTDDWLGKLWEGLNARTGDADNVLIVSADHGEYFLERGRFFHGKDVYPELVHVPLMIAGAIDEGARGTVVEQPVETRSIAATIMGLLGIREHPFAGHDLLALGDAVPPALSEGSWAFGVDERKHGVMFGGWKLILHLDDGRRELYDLSVDAGEYNDLWGTDAAAAAPLQELERQLEDFVDLPRLTPQAVGLTPEAIERLRALGYIR